MDYDNLRAAHHAQPFRPFVIRTSSGEAHPVRHPVTIASSPDVSVPFVMPGPGQVAMIGVASVTEMTHDFPTAAGRS